MERLRFCSSWAFLRFGLCAVISLGLIFGGSIGAKAAHDTMPSYYVDTLYTSTTSSCVENYRFNIGADGIFIGDSAVNISYTSGTASFSFDTGPLVSSVVPLDENYFNFDYLNYWITPSYSVSLGYSDNGFSTFAENVLSVMPYVIYDGEKHYLSNNNFNQLIVEPVLSHMSVFFGAEIDVIVSFDATSISESILKSYFGSVDLNLIFNPASVNVVGYRYISTGENAIIDALGGMDTSIEIQIEKSEEEIALQQQQNQLQQDQIDIQEETKETAKESLKETKNFFANFWDNIKNSLKSVFVPEDGYFEDLFVRMQDFFSLKLGALYAPIDIFLTVLDGFANASGTDPGIKFPGLKWEDTYIIAPQTISLSTIAKDFPDLQEKIYFATNVIMVGSVLWLLQVKLREVLKN